MVKQAIMLALVIHKQEGFMIIAYINRYEWVDDSHLQRVNHQEYRCFICHVLGHAHSHQPAMIQEDPGKISDKSPHL